MASIVLSFVGEQDPYSEKTKEEGSIVTLLRHLSSEGYEISRAILMYTKGTAKKAEDTRDHIATEAQLSTIGVELVPVSEDLSRDPTDLLKAAQEAREGLREIQGSMKAGDFVEFNASSGTPAMKSAFSILQAAGYASRSRVWQVRNPHQMQEGQSRVFETDVGVLRREFDLKVFRSGVESFDFDAAEALLGVSDIANRFAQRELIDDLLKAGMAWQRSRLDDFKGLIAAYLHPEQKKHLDQWYWSAYEEAYLAIVRYKQKNIVETFFHSFRAFEGVLAFWAKQIFGDHAIEEDGAVYLRESIFAERECFFKGAKYKKDGKPNDDLAKLECRIKKHFEQEKELKERGEKKDIKDYLLDFGALCKFFRAIRSEYKQECPAIKGLLTNEVSSKRNAVFHQLRGLQEQDLYDYWGVSDFVEWEKRLLEYLNFISQQSFGSWDEASLMAWFYQRLVEAIASYQP